MSAWFWDVLIGVLLPPGWAYVITRYMPPRRRVPSLPFFVRWCSGAGGFLLATLITRNWIGVTCGGASLAVAATAWLWWHRRRDRAPRAYGAKSRARIAALAAKAREVLRLRPVLRPVPQGSR